MCVYSMDELQVLRDKTCKILSSGMSEELNNHGLNIILVSILGLLLGGAWRFICLFCTFMITL